MELSWLLMQKILSMALMVMLGFVATKKKVLKEEDTTPLSAICLYLVCPCMLISAFQMEFSVDKVWNLLLVTAAAIVVHIFYIVLTSIVGKKLNLKPVQKASLVYSNAGNLIIPIVSSVLSAESVFYACAFIVIQNCLFWTHGIIVMGDRSQVNLKKIIMNPNIIAIVIGLGLFFARVTLPMPIADALSSVGGMIGPMSMLIVGMIMASADLKAVFSDKRAYLVCAGRLLIYPFLVILLFWISHVTVLLPQTKELYLVTFLAAAAPSASTVVQAAKLYHKDAAGASVINVMSVVLCIITMPVMIYLYQLFLY